MKIIARIHTDFPTKFGVPRQSGLVSSLQGRIVFEPEYRNADALRGLEEFTHLWLIWEFSLAVRENWSPTVRPPRLGGNERKGVFATRSPFRPNPIGLSCVRLELIEYGGTEGPVLVISGADMVDGTPIYDIKPYIPYADSHPEASGAYTEQTIQHALTVVFPEAWFHILPEEKREAAMGMLRQDPRPSYQHDPERVYGVPFAGFDIRFTVQDDTLTVTEVVRS